LKIIKKGNIMNKIIDIITDVLLFAALGLTIILMMFL